MVDLARQNRGAGPDRFALPHIRHWRTRDDVKSRRHQLAGRFPGESEGARRENGAGKWIIGRGWIETFWKPPQFPTRDELDKIAPKQPGLPHPGRWPRRGREQRRASKIAEASTRTRPNPFGGEILKDKQTGEPNGMLLDNAQDLSKRIFPNRRGRSGAQALRVGDGARDLTRLVRNPKRGELLRRLRSDEAALASGPSKLRVVNCIYGPGRGRGALAAKKARLIERLR